MRTVFATALLVVGSAAFGVQAAEFRPEAVSADARWLVHVDFDEMRDSTLGQKFREDWLKRPGTKRQLEMLREDIGFDPTQDLHSMTVYDTQFAKDHGVMILNAEIDRNQLISHLESKPGYAKVKQNGHELHRWLEQAGQRGEHAVYFGFAEGDQSVAGRFAAEVEHALDVLAGDAKSLNDTDSSLAADSPTGTAIIIRAIDLQDAELPERFPLVQHSRSFSLALGEHDESLFLNGELNTDSEEIARQVEDAAQGFRALLQLRFGDDADARQIVDQLRIERSETRVRMNWQIPVEALQKMMERERQKFAGRPALRTAG